MSPTPRAVEIARGVLRIAPPDLRVQGRESRFAVAAQEAQVHRFVDCRAALGNVGAAALRAHEEALVGQLA